MKFMMEDILKDKFNNFESTPREGLFNDILAARKRKKRVIWMWSAASILILSATYLGIQLNSDIQNQKGLTQDSTEIVSENKNSQNNAKNQLVEEETVIENRKQSSQEEVVSLDEAIENDNSRTIIESNLPDRVESNELQSEDFEEIRYTDNRSIDNRTNKDENLAKKFLEIAQANRNNDLSKAKLFVGNNELVVDAPRNNQRNKESEIEDENSSINTKNNELNKDNVEEDEKNDSPETKNPDVKDGENSIEFPKVKPSKWSVALTAGPGIGGRVLTGDNSYVNSRNYVEKAKLSYGFDLRGSYAIGKLWNIQSGVLYNVRNEAFDYTQNIMKTVDRVETREVTVIHPVLGEIKVEEEYVVTDTSMSTVSHSNSNQFKYLAIPLSIERIIPMGNNLSILARTGVQFGIYQRAYGATLDGEKNVAHYFNEKDVQTTGMNPITYKNSSVQRIELAIGASYRLNNKLSLLFYPQASYALQSSMVEVSPLKQKDFGIFTQLGFKIDL